MDKVATKAYFIYLDDHGIVHIDIRKDVHIDIEAITECSVISRELSGGKMFALVDARAHFTISDQAMEYLKKDIYDNERIATAIVTKKLGVRIMIDYLNNVLKLRSQAEMFPSVDEALRWLLSLKNGVN